MERFVFLVLAIFVAFTAAIELKDEVQLLGAEEGQRYLTIGKSDESDDEVVKCEILPCNRNNDSFIELWSKTNSTTYNPKYVILWSTRCSVELRDITMEDAGLWKTRATFKSNRSSEHKFYITVRKELVEIPLLPTNELFAYTNQTVLAYFENDLENVDNFDSCTLLNPQKTKEYNLSSSTHSNIKLIKPCGFKMKVNEKHKGEWTLYANLHNGTTYYSKLEVKVHDTIAEIPTNESATFEFGSSGAQICAKNIPNAKMCIFEDPQGKVYPMINSPCKKITEPITKYHEGIWTARCGAKGIVNLIEQKIIVDVYALDKVNSTIEITRDRINLLCQVGYDGAQMKTCNFIKPDGETLYMTIGTGNNKYSYYGTGDHVSEGKFDCGLTIHKPTYADFGTWRCLAVFGLTNTVGKILRVERRIGHRSSSTSKIKALGKDVYVKSGTSFKVSCSANEVLDYCWFRSPNGSVHSVLKGKKVSAPALAYSGIGFDLGDCTAEVKVANESDIGQWSCYMGTVDGVEVQSNFIVEFKETYLMAAEKLVVVKENEKANLIFHPLPGSNKVINSCRWVNPEGRGIHGVHHHGRYATFTSPTHCKLIINEMNWEEDVGEWTCYARFVNTNENEVSEEGRDEVTVVRADVNMPYFASIVVICLLICCTNICFFAIVCYRKRRSPMASDKTILVEKS